MQLDGYEQFLQKAAFAEMEPAGLIFIKGPDQVDFLQRQTTNDIRQLAPGRALPTVLTSPTARIIEVMYLFLEPSQDGSPIGAIPISGNASGLASYLKKRIFFMDKVTVSSSNAGSVQLTLGGPMSAQVLAQLKVEPPEADRIQTGNIAGVELSILGQRPEIGLPYRLLIPAGMKDAVEAALQEAGAACLSPKAFETLRVEAGFPSGGHELTEDFTPLETRLEAAISSDKGCYTGQEIIARQITYDKVTRKLAGLKLDSPAPAGSTITVEGKQAGAITSAAQSPRFGPIALAVLKRPYHEPGTVVAVQSEGLEIHGSVVELPFVR